MVHDQGNGLRDQSVTGLNAIQRQEERFLSRVLTWREVDVLDPWPGSR